MVWPGSPACRELGAGGGKAWLGVEGIGKGGDEGAPLRSQCFACGVEDCMPPPSACFELVCVETLPWSTVLLCWLLWAGTIRLAVR